MSKDFMEKSHRMLCQTNREIGHSIVCQKKRKKVKVQYVGKSLEIKSKYVKQISWKYLMKNSQYSMSKYFDEKSQNSLSKSFLEKKSQYSMSKNSMKNVIIAC